MKGFFTLCAIFGGTVMLVQFLLSFVGASDGDDFDVAGDGGDHVGGHDAADTDHHGSTWFFGVITFRTVVAALTFFGLAGMAASSAQLNQPLPLVVAVASGLAAMYGVYFLMRSMSRLNADGTVRIDRAVGQEAVVYLSVPGGEKGAGKVHMTLQGRLVEFEAMTSGEKLPTGSRVIVVDVLGPDLVRVTNVPQPASSTHV